MSDYIYQGQNNIRFRLSGCGDLTSASTVSIVYVKPDFTTGTWTATIEDATNGIIYYDMLSSESLIAGKYVFYPLIIFLDGRTGIGDAVEETVYAPGAVI